MSEEPQIPKGLLMESPMGQKIFIPFEEILKYEISEEEYKQREAELKAAHAAHAPAEGECGSGSCGCC